MTLIKMLLFPQRRTGHQIPSQRLGYTPANHDVSNHNGDGRRNTKKLPS